MHTADDPRCYVGDVVEATETDDGLAISTEMGVQPQWSFHRFASVGEHQPVDLYHSEKERRADAKQQMPFTPSSALITRHRDGNTNPGMSSVIMVPGE